MLPPTTIIVAAEADPSRRGKAKAERKGKNSPFLSLSPSLAIPQQMVEVEAFSSVHDMIQAALDKHGGTATLREVRLVERKTRRKVGCFFFSGRHRMRGGGGRFFSSPPSLVAGSLDQQFALSFFRPFDCYQRPSFCFLCDALSILLSMALP